MGERKRGLIQSFGMRAGSLGPNGLPREPAFQHDGGILVVLTSYNVWRLYLCL